MKQANIEWKQGQPFSAEFDDVYFSKDGGIAETEHVFLKQNGLPDLWKGRQSFTIAETGFGTGLNFLTTVKHWLNTADSESKLHYLSIENFPLSKKDLKQALSVWPEFSGLLEELLEKYPPAVAGFHQLNLFDNRVTLILMFGDVEDMLPQCDAKVDAWYLDGFSPDKNPQMWSESVFQQIARLSYENTTFSTYTVAGFVRRGLNQAGFEVKKVKGFGSKREMLTGLLSKKPDIKNAQPWFERPKYNGDKKHVVIVGGGIAGITTAWALVKRGWQVELIEKHNQVAKEGSGNPLGVLLPRVSLDDSAEGEFYSSAYFKALNAVNSLSKSGESFDWNQSGVIQLASSNRIKKQIDKLVCAQELAESINADKASELSGIEVKESALLFSQAGWLSPEKLCKKILKLAGSKIKQHLNVEVKKVVRENDQWVLLDQKDQQITKTNSVVFANAIAVKELQQTSWLAMQYVRGQISYLPANQESKNIRMPICYDGYIIPELNDQHIIGATFKPVDKSTETELSEHKENVASLNQWLPNIFDIDVNKLEGRAALRAVTPDRMPLVGPVASLTQLNNEYADLQKGKPAEQYSNAQYLSGLYVNVGHGARGITSSFLSAELIAAQLNNEPLPVSTRVQYALHPSRFTIRALKKGKLFNLGSSLPCDECSGCI
jgi:tRNA 5-methylaminomethyl-2-thiouridine biosynthesis bifunctional protein